MNDVLYMLLIILGLGVLYMTNDEYYSYSIDPTYMNPIWMCDQRMLGVFYYNVENALVSYDQMWVCVVDSP